LSETLKGSLSKKAIVVPYPSASAIVVSEVTDRWDEVEQLIVDLDRPSRARVFALAHAPAEQLVDILRQYATDANAVQADFRTNQIAISDTEPNMVVLASLIEQFDRPDKVSTRTFYLRFAPAEDVANLVREILTGQRSQNSNNGAGQPGRQQQSQQEPGPIDTHRPGHAAIFQIQSELTVYGAFLSGRELSQCPGAKRRRTERCPACNFRP
jgi:general secretion pathway protein D